MFVLGLVLILWPVVVALVAFLIALTSSSLFLWVDEALLVDLLCRLFFHLHMLHLLLLILLGYILHLRSISSWLSVVTQWIVGIIIDSLVLRFICVFHSCTFPVDPTVTMQALHMLQIVAVTHQMPLIFALALTVRGFFLEEERSFVEIHSIVVVILVLAFVELVLKVCVEFAVEIFTAHSLWHHYFQLLNLRLLNRLNRLLHRIFDFFSYFFFFIEVILLISLRCLCFLLDLFLPWLFLIDVLHLQLSLHIYDEILQILKIKIFPIFLGFLLVDSLRHFEDIDPLLQYLVHQQIPHLIFLAHHTPFSVLFEHPSKRVDVSLNS